MTTLSRRQLAAALCCFFVAGCGSDADLPVESAKVRDDNDIVAAPSRDEVPDDRVESRDQDEMPPVEPEPEVEPEPCTEENRCIGEFPTTIFDTTVGGERAWDTYGCAPDIDESGPERVYRVEIPEAGFLAVEVVSEDIDVDIDVHLLLEETAESCMDRGHYTAGNWLEPGTYYLVADTWVDEDGTEYAGDYELAFNLVTPADLAEFGMNPQLADDALKAFSTAWLRDDSRRFEYTVSDFSMHSSEDRQWIVHLSTGVLLFNLTVAHGEASIDGEDLGYSTVFSNTPESHQSSLGMIRTAETYEGDYGYSLRLDGLEPGYNDRVRDRFIVVHPWNGNLPQIVERDGWVTPTWGCPAIDPDISQQVIDTISGGALMFFWHPTSEWHSGSTYF